MEILLCLSELKRNQVLEWEGGRLGSEMIGLLLGSVAAGLQEQPDDARDWMDETDIDEVDDSYPEYAEEAIDRLAVSLGGSCVPARADSRWTGDTAFVVAARPGITAASGLEMSIRRVGRDCGSRGWVHRCELAAVPPYANKQELIPRLQDVLK